MSRKKALPPEVADVPAARALLDADPVYDGDAAPVIGVVRGVVRTLAVLHRRVVRG